MKILIIEDDPNVVILIKRSLEAASFLVESAKSGHRGLTMAKSGSYDLFIIDYSLPGIDGAKIIKNLRSVKIKAPIIMLTVRTEMKDKEEAFRLGADDYLTKPFLIEELILRIQALLRRPLAIKKESLRLADLKLDGFSGCIKRGQKSIYLTRREFCLLQYLLKRRGEIISRGEILDHVWNYTANPFSNSVETHIANLRRKINLPGKPNLIHTFPGRGYKLASSKLD